MNIPFCAKLPFKSLIDKIFDDATKGFNVFPNGSIVSIFLLHYSCHSLPNEAISSLNDRTSTVLINSLSLNIVLTFSRHIAKI